MGAALKLGLFAAYLTLSLYGLYKLKSAPFGVNLEFVLGFAAYCAGFALWLLILRWSPLSYAFPVAAGALIVGTQLLGLVLLHESFGAAKVAGAALIVAGIVLMSLPAGAPNE